MGKTDIQGSIESVEEKHPHVHGEDSNGSTATIETFETPPRAWGRRVAGDISDEAVRNTPTCMGKTIRQHL